MGNEYKINSLVDILALEDDQIDRLFAELPRVLKYGKSMMGIIQAASGEENPVVKMLSPLTWFDDGKQDITCTALAGDEVFEMKVESPNHQPTGQ